MAVTSPPDTDQRPDGSQTPDEPGPLTAEAAGLEDLALDSTEDAPAPSLRVAAAAALQVVGAGIMVGGIFLGAVPRVFAVIAGLLGVGVAILALRARKPLTSNLIVFGGLALIGLVIVGSRGPSNVFNVRALVREALAGSDLLRPPVPFELGWHALVGWLMGVIGFMAGWFALTLRRPTVAILIPIPISAVAAISVPEAAHLASGITLFILLGVGLGVLSLQTADDGDSRIPISYQVQKAARAVPLLAVVTLLIYFLAQADFLFPSPKIDPEQEPQKPKTVPLSAVEDRVLFEVESSVTGPWRIGSLDVYDGTDWRLPAFAQSRLERVPSSGVVDPDLEPGVRATITTAGLGGLVLPTLPNPVGIVTTGPTLAYDFRSGNIRLAQGTVQPGLEYDVVAAAIPQVSELEAITQPIPREIRQFTRIDPPPPAVRDLIASAPKTSKWAEFDYLRTYILDNVVATGSGTPKSITPERVAQMTQPGTEASPFEIVAAQAMLARWVGLPSRIGYGFDGGEQVGGKLQVRPIHGASFVEVYFPGYKWLPVIGKPKQAKPTTSGSTTLRTDQAILPSDDIAVRLVFPVITPAPSNFAEQVQSAVLIALPILALLLALYFGWPVARKAVLRSRLREAARAAGPSARIALAYKEWRDFATDFGCNYPSDTPLMFLHRFAPDEEHRELAWLATRALWGDLHGELTEDHAVHAEELSRSLRRRMAAAQAATLRAVAVVSRLSLRNPYGDLDARVSKDGHGRERATAALAQR